MITQLINKQGNAVKNQFVISTNETTSFQSYDSTIAIIDHTNNNSITLDLKWCYSQTTLKHLKLFLNIEKSKKEIQKDIVSGLYIIKQLN